MSRRIRILVVEDNPADAYLINDLLSETGSRFDIAIARDGEEALDRLLRRRADVVTPRPDFVLLDLNLPKVSGHEVISEVRKSRDLRGLPIIVLTSSGASRDIATSYALGASCHVTKPGDLVAFQSTMKAITDFWCGVVTWPDDM
jgi:CheY-like chemotaxis protein